MKSMKIKDFFYLFKKNKINQVEFLCNETKNFCYTIFKNEIINYSTSKTNSNIISIVKNNKRTTINFEKEINKKNIQEIIKNLLEINKFSNKEGIILDQKLKYQKFVFFNKDLEKINVEKKINKILQIEKKIKKYSDLIKEVKVTYSEEISKQKYCNSNDINLNSKYNFFSINSYIILKDKNVIQSNELSFNDNDFLKFDIEKYVKKICEEAIKKMNGTTIKTGEYQVIFDSNITDIFLNYYISQLNAEKILKNTSWFRNKINTQVANKKITIYDMPLQKGINFIAYDHQGYPTSNKVLIENGILKTYLHSLETAKKFKVQPTGNAVLINSSIDIRPHNVCLKPGSLTKKKLIEKIKNGVYITSIEGLHAGMNIETGDFSLKSNGFIIKNGKIDKHINMMIINSNLYNIFNDIIEISENIEYSKNFFAPCIYLNKIFISCK